MTECGLVLPRWGTRRRTRAEWLDAGGDPKLAPKTEPLWPTLGHQPGIVARRLKLPPMPHQQHVFDVAFELDPHPEKPGDLWYSESNVWVMRQCGKGLALDTPIPTPDGWTTMGELDVGDVLFDDAGALCSVTYVSPRRLLDCYRVTFSDDTSVIADGDHLWTLYDTHASNGRGRSLGGWITVSTRDIAGRTTFNYRGKSEARYRLPESGPLQCPEQTLPIDPWLLGAWLGDGTSLAPDITIGDDDLADMSALIEAAGATIEAKPDRSCWRVRVLTSSDRAEFSRSLRAAGVWGDKHIPDQYLRGSVGQRLALLQGLMDSDGTVTVAGTNSTSRRCEFSVVNRRLAEGFLELATSLGIRTRMQEAPAVIDGRVVGTRYRIGFTTHLDVFRLPRKAARHAEQGPLRRIARNIKSITPAPTVPTRCIQVDSPTSLFRCGTSMIPTHNTMGILFPVIVHRCTMMPRRMGGRQRASFTMQDRQETRKKLEIDLIPQLEEATESFRRITNPKARPGRSTAEWKSSLNNGSEHLLFGKGNYMLIETPSLKAGHGGTIDLKAADEVRFGVDDRLEASAGPAQITRRSSQLWVASTAGDERSYYMWPKVLAGRNRIERGDTETRVCSFEWSIPEDADLHDPDVWFDHHPAVGHTIALDDILAELRKAEDSPDETKVDTFRQEYANQWVRHPIIGEQQHEPIFDPDLWGSREVAAVSTFPTPCTIGAAVSDDGRSSAVAVAFWSDGAGVVKILDHRPGTFWLERELEVHREAHRPEVFTYDAGGPTNAIAGAIGRAAGTTTVDAISGRAYTSACSGFVTGFVEGRYRHMGQEWLNASLDGIARKQRGEAWLWDLQASQSDPTPTVAATVALRALEMHRPEPEDTSAFVSFVLGG